MGKILSSASKIVFVFMALGAVVLTFMGKLTAENYMFLTGMAFSFFFSYKSENKDNSPYNGK